jgi:hypothetical protein
MAETENTFPTIRDIRDRMNDLVEQGLGELPVQILIVPDSTLQAIARNAGQKDDAKPALMIDLFDGDGNSVTLAAVERWGNGSARPAVQ